jgi:hypothetical protein
VIDPPRHRMGNRFPAIGGNPIEEARTGFDRRRPV